MITFLSHLKKKKLCVLTWFNIIYISQLKKTNVLEFNRYIPGIGICMKKIGMNPVLVRYGVYWYWFGMEDANMMDIGIGISVSY